MYMSTGILRIMRIRACVRACLFSGSRITQLDVFFKITMCGGCCVFVAIFRILRLHLTSLCSSVFADQKEKELKLRDSDQNFMSSVYN